MMIKKYISDKRASMIRKGEFFNHGEDDVCTVDRILTEFDPVINKTFSFILAMDWRRVALAFLVVSKQKNFFFCYALKVYLECKRLRCSYNRLSELRLCFLRNAN